MVILTRWMAAFLLLAVTFNPTPYNYMRWLRDYGSENVSIAVLSGLVILTGYVVFLRAGLRSIGPAGMTLVLVLVGTLFWVLYDFGILKLENETLNTWLGLFALSVVLAVGLGWSHVRRALSGQTDVDDIDD